MLSLSITLSLWIIFVLQLSVNCFLTCPPGGKRICTSNEIPYNLTTLNNFSVSNCIYENCPQVIIDSCVGLSISNVTFRKGNGTANLYHGGALVILGNQYQSQVSISNCRFENIFSGSAGPMTYRGGAIYATGTVLISDTSFVNNTSVEQGGAVMVTSSLGFNCTRCTFSGNLATSGGAVAIDQALSNSPYLYFVDSTFDQNHAILSYGSSALGGAIYVVGTGKLYTLNCTISNGYADTLAGGIYATGRPFITLKRSKFISNYAIYSGFLHIDGGNGCQLTVQDCFFGTNLADFYGGALRILGECTILIENNLFLANHALYGSSVFLSRISANNVINIRNCTFDSEKSQMSTVYMEVVTLAIDNCLFVNCNAEVQGGALFSDLTSGKVTFTNTRFVNLTSGAQGGVLEIRHNGIATVQNCTFTGCSSKIGGAIAISQYPATLNVINCVFTGNNAIKYGGDIHITVNSVVTISGSKFISSLSDSGGSIYYDGTASVTLTNTNFFNNVAIQNGGSIYSTGSGARFIITNCNFYNSKSITGGSIALSTSNGVLSNVNFVGSKSSRYGGSIYANGGSLSLTNCYSVNSTSLTGGFLYAFGETISLSNSQIVSSRSALSGGSISISNCQLGLTSSNFTDTSSGMGGFIYLSDGSSFSGNGLIVDESVGNFGGIGQVDSGSQFVCESCSFSNFNSPSNGSFLYLNGGSQATLGDCQVQNSPGIIFSSFMFVRMSNLAMFNLNFAYLNSVTGSLLNAIEGSTCVFTNVQVTNAVATGVKGSIVLVESLSTATFVSSTFRYPKAEIIFSATSGSLIEFQGSQLSFYGIPPIDATVITDWYNQLNKYIFQATFDSTIVFNDNLEIDSFSGINVALIEGTLTCKNSVINNTLSMTCPFFGKDSSTLQFTGCSILNSQLTGAVDPCNFGSGVSSFGGAISSSGSVLLDGSSLLQGNIAHYGGAIAMSGSGSLTLGSGVNITNNVALLYGGAFYIDSQGPNIITGNQVFISNNLAPSFPESSLGYFRNGYLDIDPTVLQADLTLNGGIYVFNHLIAEALSQNSSILNQGTKDLKWEGRAKRLSFLGNYLSGSSIKLTLSQDIPVITIAAVDGFNEIASVDPSNLVIVEISETSQNASLLGETIKSISDQNTGLVSIRSLSIINRTAGLYTLLIRAKAGTLDFNGIDPNPLTLNILYRDCLPGSEQYIMSINSCVPIQKINNGIRITLTLICVLLIIGCIGTLMGLHKFREFHLIKANSYVYLSVPVIGCLLAFMGPILSSVSCLASTFVENIGFCLIFSSFLIKLYRIRVIFGRSDLILTKETINSLKDSSLARILYVGLVVTCSYQIMWGVLGDPSPIPIFVPDLGVLISDLCHLDSSFALGMAAIKFVVSIIVAYLAYINRNVPSDFNEAKKIGFSCYNWVIFGTFISLTSQFIITNPNVAFLVKGLSLILSHSYTTLYLASYKVYRCWRFPDISRVAKKSKIVSTALEDHKFSKQRTNNNSTLASVSKSSAGARTSTIDNGGKNITISSLAGE